MNNPILRFSARIGTLLLALGLILAPLLFGTLGSDSPSGSPEPVTITQYTSELAVDRNGELTATETITADFPNDRRGIFRYWDLTDPLDPKVRYEPKDIKVTMDGQYVPVEMSWERGRKLRVAKIGDPDQTLTPGEHTYVISFRVPGVISPEEEGSRFEWRAIADGWRMHIDRADIIVTLPHAPNNPVCRVGTNQECDQFEVAGNTLTATATRLAPNTAVRVASTFDEAAPAQTTAPWAIKYEPVLGKSAILVGFIALLTVAAVGVSHTIERLTRETAPGFPVMFEPPDGLGPVQTYFITHESVGKNALSATLMHLAERGAITLDRSKNKTWTIKGNWNDSKWSELDEVANAMGHALGIRSAGSIFRADGTENAGHALTRAEYGIEDAAQQWAQSSGLVESVKHETRYKYLITLCAVAALIPVFAPVMPTLWAAPFAAAVVGGIGIFGKGVGTRRTAFGRELWSRAGGFARFLTTPSADDRFQFSARKNLYTEYIPFAVAFNVADAWAARYQTVAGFEVSEPSWLPVGIGATGIGAISQSISSFNSSLSSSIYAYESATSSSSSGGSGGGFSGGGGGGGGGGSW